MHPMFHFLAVLAFKKLLTIKYHLTQFFLRNFFQFQLSASTKAGKRGSEIIATHLKEEHGDRAVKLVVSLTPCVRKVMFVLPSGKEVLEIVLSGRNLPDMIHECFVSSFVQELEEVVQCCVSQEIFPAKAESVLVTRNSS